MKIARVTGTVTATVKDSCLVAHPLLIVDVQDARGKFNPIIFSRSRHTRCQRWTDGTDCNRSETSAS